MDKKLTYEAAGVNIGNAEEAKREMAGHMHTKDKRVLNRPGAFASLFEADFTGIEHPVLVLKAEEPGSKQLLAFQHNKIRGICFDLINHLVNDIIVMGAKPEAVLDIILCGKLEKETVVQIVTHISEACREQECSLVGGETSEQPEVLPEGSYMLSASVLGVVDRDHIIDGSRIRVGDEVLALASNGLHTNGYTLVRKLMEEFPAVLGGRVDGETFVDAILRPHKCYYGPLKELLGKPELHGLAHITGGGLQGNLNRILPAGMDALVSLDRIEIPEIFHTIQAFGKVPPADMLRTFNMGVGIALVASPDAMPRIQEHLARHDCHSFIIGKIVEGDRQVRFEGELQLRE
ncbi:phosphoribosylformylglycinamidine cyclo-ligase [Paenibacillus sp. sptzw28]|uniref:phosphoribosylformylglycinamidine cyclo-ligase n=1 Tax=Paenibacillus sp. sptzw28 TaxID=715179 RepID=UPI001C6E9C9A|nr:phosphoribosylformylglycinamidine cyclo-ligase [Paenibacillus sp. sptzw28]QYR21989.1 phosphoribosylformylglycinamidine cyclo-ligase [Paenibacillus sp. sptzw28]